MTSSAAPTLLSPRILIPFIIVTLIWGSTWLVIRDQLGTVPESWSVTYRFGLATVAMMKGMRMRGERRVGAALLVIWPSYKEFFISIKQ